MKHIFKIGSLGKTCTESSDYLHISNYMDIKQLKISYELGISLSIESIRLIKTLTEGYAAIYMILDHVNNKTYVGSTFGSDISSVHSRLSQHKTLLLKDLKNYELYILKSYFVKDLLALNDSLNIDILDKVIREYESILIADIKPELNTSINVQTYAMEINKKHTSESINLIRDASLSRPSPSAESRKDMSKSHIGAKLSETHKENIRKAGGRPIKILLATKEELIFNSILEALDNDWISISERTLKRRLEDSKEFQTLKGLATAVYAEEIDSGKIINDPKFLLIMKDTSIVSKLEALLSIKLVYSKTNKRVTRERLEQAIKKYGELNE